MWLIGVNRSSINRLNKQKITFIFRQNNLGNYYYLYDRNQNKCDSIFFLRGSITLGADVLGPLFASDFLETYTFKLNYKCLRVRQTMIANLPFLIYFTEKSDMTHQYLIHMRAHMIQKLIIIKIENIRRLIPKKEIIANEIQMKLFQ